MVPHSYLHNMQIQTVTPHSSVLTGFSVHTVYKPSTHVLFIAKRGPTGFPPPESYGILGAQNTIPIIKAAIVNPSNLTCCPLVCLHVCMCVYIYIHMYIHTRIQYLTTFSFSQQLSGIPVSPLFTAGISPNRNPVPQPL